MHVVSIAPSFSTTGVSVHVRQINRHLLDGGHRVTFAPLSVAEPRIVCCSGEDHRSQAVPDVAATDDWFDEKLALVDAYVAALSQLDLAEPVGLVHSHDWLAALAGARLATRFGCPHLTTVHTLAEIQRERAGLPGRLPPHRRQIEEESGLCRRSERMLTVGKEMRALMLDVGGIPPDRVAVVPNGVDLARFAAPAPAAVAALRRRLAPAGEQLVLFVGRLAPQKGLDFLLRSTYRVRRERPATRWVVVGDAVAANMMRPIYEQVMNEGGYRDHLQFEGAVPWEQMPLYYHAADCVAVPSLFEACPYVVLEAMAAETCVVATDLASLREVITHDETGLLVSVEETAQIRGPSIAALAEMQGRVLTDAALRDRLTGAARRTIEGRFTLARHLRATDALYTDLLAHRNGRRG